MFVCGRACTAIGRTVASVVRSWHVTRPVEHKYSAFDLALRPKRRTNPYNSTCVDSNTAYFFLCAL